MVSSRFLNKILFFNFGKKGTQGLLFSITSYLAGSLLQIVLEHACANLDRKIGLTVDGIVIPLPPMEGLIVLNIPFWGAGYNLGSAYFFCKLSMTVSSNHRF
ncbi:hypothetical protein LOAG_06609 [Loa loa]|uniref:Uncharacterized protein n=1 Tax=Loa loa TaxID=7209 RepID=A0A1S0TXB4_LOALO|nr:hypothetical protein LOAG_06609 [Loa loa]EFO21873.1 hypothetical protein LOAG_06609 [Loa loa]